MCHLSSFTTSDGRGLELDVWRAEAYGNGIKKYGKIKEELIAGKETISPEDKERERDDEAEEKD